jgi:hypothetical protein
MQDLIGKKVTVHSTMPTGEKQDVGVVESFDGTILKLKTEKGDLYFTIHFIRLIKLF